jgi:hypothetical protein
VAVAVAVAVAVVAGTVFSGAGTGSSTVTVRAGGRGGTAPSRLPALMRPRRNPTSSPKSSPTANVANHIRTVLSDLTLILPGLVLLLLLPIVLSLPAFPCRLILRSGSMHNAGHQLLRTPLLGTWVNRPRGRAEALSRPDPFQMLLLYESRSLRSPFFSFTFPFL